MNVGRRFCRLLDNTGRHLVERQKNLAETLLRQVFVVLRLRMGAY